MSLFKRTAGCLKFIFTLLRREFSFPRNEKHSFGVILPRPPPPRPSSFQFQDSPFFNLPREVRDLIYHHYWTLHPRLAASRRHPANPLSKRLHYEGRESADNPAMKLRWHFQNRNEKPCPSLLRLSKQALCEALEQYERGAEWYWSVKSTSKLWHLPLGLHVDFERASKVTFWVGDFMFPVTREFPHYERNEFVYEAVLTNYLRSGLPLTRLRISGYTDTLQWSHTEFGDMTYFGDATAIAHQVFAMFGRDAVPKLELEIFDATEKWRRRVLYEVRKEGLEVYSHTLDSESRGLRVVQGREGWSWTSEEGILIESEVDPNAPLSEHPTNFDWSTVDYSARLRHRDRMEDVRGSVARDEFLVVK